MAIAGIWLRALLIGIPLIVAGLHMLPAIDSLRLVGRPIDTMALGGQALVLGSIGIFALASALYRSVKLVRRSSGRAMPILPFVSRFRSK